VTEKELLAFQLAVMVGVTPDKAILQKLSTIIGKALNNPKDPARRVFRLNKMGAPKKRARDAAIRASIAAMVAGGMKLSTAKTRFLQSWEDAGPDFKERHGGPLYISGINRILRRSPTR
jgi:hypothetical protein